jgi:hypothetical protein
MADLFPKPFQTPTCREQSSTCDSKGEAGLSHSFPTRFFSPAFLALLAMELWTSSPIRPPLPFDNSREVVLDVYNPIRPLNPLYQSFGCLFWARRCT